MEAIDKEEGKTKISNSVFPAYQITPTLTEKKYPTSIIPSFFLFFCIALESPAAASISAWPSFLFPLSSQERRRRIRLEIKRWRRRRRKGDRGASSAGAETRLCQNGEKRLRIRQRASLFVADLVVFLQIQL